MITLLLSIIFGIAVMAYYQHQDQLEAIAATENEKQKKLGPPTAKAKEKKPDLFPTASPKEPPLSSIDIVAAEAQRIANAAAEALEKKRKELEEENARIQLLKAEERRKEEAAEAERQRQHQLALEAAAEAKRREEEAAKRSQEAISEAAKKLFEDMKRQEKLEHAKLIAPLTPNNTMSSKSNSAEPKSDASTSISKQRKPRRKKSTVIKEELSKTRKRISKGLHKIADKISKA